jgi:hypothetical protein
MCFGDGWSWLSWCLDEKSQGVAAATPYRIFDFCVSLRSGWRGFGPVRVDWLLEYRRTGGNRVGNIKRIRREGHFKGTVN